MTEREAWLEIASRWADPRTDFAPLAGVNRWLASDGATGLCVSTIQLKNEGLISEFMKTRMDTRLRHWFEPKGAPLFFWARTRAGAKARVIAALFMVELLEW
jgi:antibiotic biosynthesis monooxygenase (ABM) superfamily enzyme